VGGVNIGTYQVSPNSVLGGPIVSVLRQKNCHEKNWRAISQRKKEGEPRKRREEKERMEGKFWSRLCMSPTVEACGPGFSSIQEKTKECQKDN